MNAHHNPANRPMQEAFRVLAKLRTTDKVAVFVHFNAKTLGHRVTIADCSKALWQETQHDAEKMARCAGVYRLPVEAKAIADDLHEIGVPLEFIG